jgi:hypothetical protein
MVMVAQSEVTHRQALIDAARALGTFSLDDLVVKAWEANPERFGMTGYPYPDKHKVSYYFYGEKGLLKAGDVRRSSGKFVYVPFPGLAETLARCLECEAVRLPLADVTWEQACELWDCSGAVGGWRSKGDELHRHLRLLDDGNARLVLNVSLSLAERYSRWMRD